MHIGPNHDLFHCNVYNSIAIYRAPKYTNINVKQRLESGKTKLRAFFIIILLVETCFVIKFLDGNVRELQLCRKNNIVGSTTVYVLHAHGTLGGLFSVSLQVHYMSRFHSHEHFTSGLLSLFCQPKQVLVFNII